MMSDAIATHVAGWASLGPHRVAVTRSSSAEAFTVTAPRDHLEGWEHRPADATYGYSREPLAVAQLPVSSLSDIALVETRSRTASTLAGLDALGEFAVVDGAELPVHDTAGFVVDGVPQLQLEWPAATPPPGLAWTRGSSGRHAQVPRAAVSRFVRRTVTARWSQWAVTVVRIDGDSALVRSGQRGGPRPAPSIATSDSPDSGWSAVVPADSLSLERETEVRFDPPPVHYPTPIARFGGFVERVGLLEVDGEPVDGIAAIERRIEETPEPGMRLYPSSPRAGSVSSWRGFVPATELTGAERVFTEARVEGEWRSVAWIDRESWRVFGPQDEIPFGRIEAFRHRADPVDLRAEPRVPTRRSFLEAIGTEVPDE